jgi:hypothetical protein
MSSRLVAAGSTTWGSRLITATVSADRHHRVGGVIFGAEQALFLRRPGGEDDAARRFRPGGEGAGDFEQLGGAGGIVDGAVADGVAGRVGAVAAIGVPMRAIEDGFLGAILARQAADDIVAGEGVAFNLAAGAERRTGQHKGA